MGITVSAPRVLNHVELVYRPGEREVAKALFEALGCTVRDSGGPFLSAMVDGPTGNFLDNVMYCSEVTKEQWALEQALQGALDDDGDLGDAGRAYAALLGRAPQHAFHFGITYDSLAAWEESLSRIEKAGADDPDLKGRLGVRKVFRPGDPGSFGDTFVQAFIHTDVVAAGLLTLGQHIELQHYFPEHPGR
jgi:hypothetical protein